MKPENVTDFREKITDCYIIFLLTAYLLFTGISGYVYLHLKKYIMFSAVTSIWIITLLIVTAYHIIRDRRLLKLEVPEVLMLLFMACACIATVLSEYGEFISLATERYDGLLTHLLYGAIFLGVYRYGRIKRKYIYCFASAYLLNCIISFIQLLGHNALWLYPNNLNYYSPYVQEVGIFLGTTGNIDVASALHCIALPLFGSYILLSSDKLRYWLLTPFFLGLVCLVASGVSSGIIAIVITLLLLFPMFIGIKLGKKLGWIGPTLIATALAALFFLPNLGGSLGELQSILHGEIRPEFGSHRILIWQKTMDVIKEYPFFGVGPDTLDIYIGLVFERYSEVLGEVKQSIVDNAHNEYLQLIASFGIIGSIPIFSLVIYTVVRFIKSKKSATLWCIAASLVCYAIQAFFNLGLCIVVPYVFALLGIMAKAVVSKNDGSLFM